jgi:hypothetical protein
MLLPVMGPPVTCLGAAPLERGTPGVTPSAGGAGVSYREVPVHQVREVIRLWLAREGLRSTARLAQIDRKTVARY